MNIPASNPVGKVSKIVLIDLISSVVNKVRDRKDSPLVICTST